MTGQVLFHNEQLTLEPIVLTFTHDAEEYAKAWRLYSANFYNARYYMGLSGMILLFGLFLIWFELEFLISSVFAVVGGVVFFLNYYAYYILPRQYFQRNKQFKESYRLACYEDFLLFRLKGAESKIEWGFYSKAWEADEFYFLCYDKDAFTLIPKRVFVNQAQHEAFRILVQRKIGLSRFSGLLEEQPKTQKQEYLPPQNPPDWR